jgi:hypothetical protein
VYTNPTQIHARAHAMNANAGPRTFDASRNNADRRGYYYPGSNASSVAAYDPERVPLNNTVRVGGDDDDETKRRKDAPVRGANSGIWQTVTRNTPYVWMSVTLITMIILACTSLIDERDKPTLGSFVLWFLGIAISDWWACGVWMAMIMHQSRPVDTKRPLLTYFADDATLYPRTRPNWLLCAYMGSLTFSIGVATLFVLSGLIKRYDYGGMWPSSQALAYEWTNQILVMRIAGLIFYVIVNYNTPSNEGEPTQPPQQQPPQQQQQQQQQQHRPQLKPTQFYPSVLIGYRR